MNSFDFFKLKRKFMDLYPIEGFFELHPPAERAGSRATKGKKGKKWVQRHHFLAN